MDWLKRFSQAIDYIELNLDSEISYDEAANIACCSTNYFQRMFSYVVGLPLSEYIRQRRMTQAAFDLQNSKEKIRDIGAKYGYVSPASFHRAFQAVHGVSPSEARLPGTELNSYPCLHFSVSISSTNGFRYRVEEREAMRFVGVTLPLPNNISQYENYYGKFWNDSAANGTLRKIIELNGDMDSTVCGLISDIDPRNPIYYLAVQTDKPTPRNMSEIVIPTSQWAVFTYFGKKLLTYEEANKRFFTEWLPFTDYEVAQTAEMKVYPIREVFSNPFEYCSKCEFGIAIKKEQKR
jgi:AraC family transcriptional regulator